jgi:hypothetical protein
MYQPSGLGTNRPRRKRHAHILRITVRHHMPLVSTEDLIWPIEALAHIDGLDFFESDRILMLLWEDPSKLCALYRLCVSKRFRR